MALENPNSAKLRTDNIDVNKLLRPKYSAPKVCIRIVLRTKGNKSVMNRLIIPQAIFLRLFLFFLVSLKYTTLPVYYWPFIFII